MPVDVITTRVDEYEYNSATKRWLKFINDWRYYELVVISSQSRRNYKYPEN